MFVSRKNIEHCDGKSELLSLIILCLVFTQSMLYGTSCFALSGYNFGEDGDGAGYSATLTPDNRLAFSYFSISDQSLKYSESKLGEWQTSVVISSGINAQTETSLVFYNNSPYIFSINSFGHLLASSLDSSGAWYTRLVDNSPTHGGVVSATLCGTEICVSYHDKSSRLLKHAKGLGGSWKREVVDSTPGVGESSAIALQQNGLPLIVYADSSKNVAKIAYMQESGAWIFEIVDLKGHSLGAYPSVFTKEGEIHFSSSRPAVGVEHDLGLYYAVKKPGSGWNVVMVSNDYVGDRSAVVVDAEGMASLVHRYQGEDLDSSVVHLSSLGNSGFWSTRELPGDNPQETAYSYDNFKMLSPPDLPQNSCY